MERWGRENRLDGRREIGRDGEFRRLTVDRLQAGSDENSPAAEMA
jgi:hypothetical protein